MSQKNTLTPRQQLHLQALSSEISYWLREYDVRNEKGDPINFERHPFLYDIYQDQSDYLVVLKAAQVGLSTLEILKNIRDAELQKMDIIYTLPTDADVGTFVGGKVNRIIASTPHFLKITEADSIEKKQIGQSMLYFRGTWTKKSAIMITADRLVHDEKDSSKQDVVADYQARLQASKFKQTHVFSHPSVPNNGVDVEWQQSDQKEWFIVCPACKFKQFLSWNTEDNRKMSVDFERRAFVCKKCKAVLSDEDRKKGEWVARWKIGGLVKVGDNWVRRKYSGYHISLLMCPWVSAGEIIDKFNDPKQTIDYFYNKVLGLPYAGGDNSVSEETILKNVTAEGNLYKGRLVLGVDTGKKLHWVLGNEQGLVGYGVMKDYMPDATNKLSLNETIEYFLKGWPDLICVIDQGGDIIGSRKLQQKYAGRVFLCHYQRDRKTQELIDWGKSAENGTVRVDRHRAIQWVIGEFKDRRIRLYNGGRESWYNYYVHWSHIYRIVEENQQLQTPEYKWLRNDRDDWVHATIYWRVGMSRFGSSGSIDLPTPSMAPNSYMVRPDDTVRFNPDELFGGPTDDPDDPWWAQEDEDEDDYDD